MRVFLMKRKSLGIEWWIRPFSAVSNASLTGLFSWYYHVFPPSYYYNIRYYYIQQYMRILDVIIAVPSWPLGLVSFATVRRRWCLQGCGGASWWAASMVEHDGVSGAGLRGSGEISVGLADAGAVASVGATLPSWRALGEAFLSCPCAYRGKP
jgi:hypothetical protein